MVGRSEGRARREGRVKSADLLEELMGLVHGREAALLLDRGAGIDRQVGWYQTTALHHAVDSESTETVRLLLERGADVKCPQPRSPPAHGPGEELAAHALSPQELPTHGASE